MRRAGLARFRVFAVRNGTCHADVVQQRTQGIGIRRTSADPRWGAVDIMDVAPCVSTPVGELAIRAAVTRLLGAGASVLAPVHAVERDDAGLHVVARAADGRRVSSLLTGLHTSPAPVPDEALLEMAGMIVTAVGWLHDLPGRLSHGAIAPDHIVIRDNGQLVLTDGMFGDAIARLRWSRERLWKEFGIVTLSCAGEPVLDQQADIAGVGAVMLSLMLRRPLREAEFPYALPDLIMAATVPLPEWGIPLRSWMQRALHLRPGFTSSAEAVQAFARVMDSSTARRDAARALFATVFPPVASP